MSDDENKLMSDLFGDDDNNNEDLIESNNNNSVKKEEEVSNTDMNEEEKIKKEVTFNNDTNNDNNNRDDSNNNNNNDNNNNDNNNNDDDVSDVDMADLFGEEDDDDNDDNEEKVTMDNDVEDTNHIEQLDDLVKDEEDEEITKPKIEYAGGEPYHMMTFPLERPSCLDPSNNPKLLNIILPKSIAFEQEPFDPSAWVLPKLDPNTKKDKYGRGETDLWSTDTVIRWRVVTDEDGNLMRQSNSKIVKWSDGSMQLMIGKNAYDLEINKISKKGESYLIAKVNNTNEINRPIYKVMAPITGTATCKPTNMRESLLAKKYEILNRKRQQQVPKIKHTMEAPTYLDKLQIKAEERLVDAQDRRRRARESRDSRKSKRNAVSANFLEAGMDDQSSSEEEYQRPLDSTRLLEAQQTTNGIVDVDVVDDDDDDDEDDDEMEMNQRARKRRRTALIDEDDDDEE